MQESMQEALGWFESLGGAGDILFMVCLALTLPLMIPNTLFELGAGVLFPWWQGVLYLAIAEIVGCSAAFMMARKLFPLRWKQWLLNNRKFRLVSHTLTRDGWRAVLITRLLPLFPFKFSNLAYGVTPISFRDYFIGNSLGMLPRLMINTYIGYLIGDIAHLNEGRSPASPQEWALVAGAAVVATICLVLFARMARRAFHAHRDEQPPV